MSIDMSLCRKMPRASMRISTDVTRMPVRCQTSDFKKGVSWPFSACVSLLMNMQRTLQHICQPVYKKCAIICKHLPLQAPHYRSQNKCQTACKKACEYPCQLLSGLRNVSASVCEHMCMSVELSGHIPYICMSVRQMHIRRNVRQNSGTRVSQYVQKRQCHVSMHVNPYVCMLITLRGNMSDVSAYASAYADTYVRQRTIRMSKRMSVHVSGIRQ